MNRSIALGVLAAGLGPCLVWGLIVLLGYAPAHTTFTLFVLFSLVAYQFTVAIALIVGLPLFLLFNRFHMIRWWSAAFCGLIAGVLAAFIFALPHAPLTAYVRLYALYGMASALLFWVTWRHGARA
jgi:ABC-type polysaccharide/polyol phosphate export permease